MPLPEAYAQATEAVSSKWKGTTANGGKTKNYINGQFTDSKTDKWLEVHDPSTQKVVNLVPETTEDEFNEAVAAAKEAYKTWSKTSIIRRQRVVFEYVERYIRGSRGRMS